MFAGAGLRVVSEETQTAAVVAAAGKCQVYPLWQSQNMSGFCAWLTWNERGSISLLSRNLFLLSSDKLKAHFHSHGLESNCVTHACLSVAVYVCVFNHCLFYYPMHAK